MIEQVLADRVHVYVIVCLDVWCAASLERYREKKTTRQCGTSKIRYQIRKTNADNRPRFKVRVCESGIHFLL